MAYRANQSLIRKLLSVLVSPFKKKNEKTEEGSKKNTRTLEMIKKG